MEKPEGVVYCHSKTVIEYRLVNPEKNGTAANVDLTVNGKTSQYMTAYSWFGSNRPTPKNFKFAILGEKQFDPYQYLITTSPRLKILNIQNVINQV